MLARALALLLFLGVPATVVGQTPPAPPHPVAPYRLVAPTSAPAADQQQSLEELQRLIAARDELAEKIRRLRELTGQNQQVVVSVKMCELSLNKARNTDIDVAGIEPGWLHANGFAAALSAGVFDKPGQAEDAQRVESGNETFRGVVENAEALQATIALLKKAGALKVLAEPTLVAVSGRTASFQEGGTFPIPVLQSDGGSTIEFKSFGTQLDVTPVVLGNRRIRLLLRPSVSQIDTSQSVELGDVTVPGSRVRRVDTTVEMSAGQTFVVAGLVQQRALHQGREESGTAGGAQNPGDEPKEHSEGTTGASQDEIEEVELIVLVRAEIVDAPKLPRPATINK